MIWNYYQKLVLWFFYCLESENIVIEQTGDELTKKVFFFNFFAPNVTRVRGKAKHVTLK